MLARFVLLLTGVLLLALGPGCVAAQDEDVDSGGLTEEALVNCAGDLVVYEAPRTSAVVPLWDEPGGRAIKDNASSVDLLPGGRVVRTAQTIETPDGSVWLRVKLLKGSVPGYQGWAPAASLVATKPASGVCASGRDPKQNMSAVERETASTKSLGASWVSGTMQCVVGLGEGGLDEGRDMLDGMRALIHGLPAIGRGAASMLESGLQRDRDVVLAALGNQAALKRVQDGTKNDAQRLQAALAGIAHVVTILREYLEQQYFYFSQLDADHKARYVCKLVGRLAFDVVLSVVSAGTMTALRSGAKAGEVASTLEKVEQENIELAKVAEIPERVGTTGAVYVRQEIFARDFTSQWEALRAASDGTTKKTLLRWFSGEGNPLYDLDRVQDGNCGFAAIATLFSVGTGHAVCPMAYLQDAVLQKIEPGAQSESSFGSLLDQLARASSLEGKAAPVVVGDGTASPARLEELLADFEEGQLGILISYTRDQGHATVITRIDGALTIVNNQSWNEVDRGSEVLQNLSEWDVAWKERTKSDYAGYQVMKSGFSLPK